MLVTSIEIILGTKVGNKICEVLQYKTDIQYIKWYSSKGEQIISSVNSFVL